MSETREDFEMPEYQSLTDGRPQNTVKIRYSRQNLKRYTELTTKKKSCFYHAFLYVALIHTDSRSSRSPELLRESMTD